MNAPNRIDTWILEDDQKPLTITEDAKIPNAATITLRKQDHTIGNMIRAQLLLDPTVLFAGYKVPHPLENDIEIKIQTDDQSNPADALKRACTLLIAQTTEVKRQFSEQARNVEIGQFNEPAAANVGLGGFDPYGDGLGGGQGQGGAGQAVYDF